MLVALGGPPPFGGRCNGSGGEVTAVQGCLEAHFARPDRASTRGNSMQYLLLNESGSKAAYTRPRKAADGNYFKLPYSYWADGYDVSLDQSERLMLLIGLDQQDGFALPLNQVRRWYGVSEGTARRGLRGLEARSLLMSTSMHVPSAMSPTGLVESANSPDVTPAMRTTTITGTSMLQSWRSVDAALAGPVSSRQGPEPPTAVPRQPNVSRRSARDVRLAIRP